MWKRHLAAALGLLVTAGLGLCQSPAGNPPALEVPLENSQSAGPRFWASGEYLLWWIKDQPFPDALLVANSTGGPATVGAPGAVVVLGGNQEMNALSGLRLSGGAWLDSSHTIGVEVGGYHLFERSRSTTIASDAAGNPLTAIAFTDAATGLPSDGIVLSAPGVPRAAGLFRRSRRSGKGK